MRTELGVKAARQGRDGPWTWGEAIIDEAGWKPPGKGGGVTQRGEHSKNSLNAYRETVAVEAQLELGELPSETSLRTYAFAYFHAKEYREEIAISTAYEAAVAVTSKRYDGTVAELLEAARDGNGRVRVDGVREAIDKAPATPKRPREAIEHFQRAGDDLRAGAKLMLDAESVPSDELVLLLDALRQAIEVATFLVGRFEGKVVSDEEIARVLNVSAG